jgi:hypothetical protein
MVVHVSSSGTQETEAGGLRGQGQHELHVSKIIMLLK